MSDVISTPPWPRHGLHELVAEQANRTPDRVAVRCGARSLSYRELVDAGDRAAARLTERGVGPGHVVAVMVDRSVELPVALLAVLGSGAAFVPVDPAYPRERQEHMLHDSGASTTLTVDRLAGRAATADVLTLDSPEPPCRSAVPGPAQDSRSTSAATTDGLAYIMYTSGSTGRPKGVAVDHRCLVKGVLAMGAAVRPGPGDVGLSVTSASFDPVLVELFLPLVHGSTVEVATEQQVLDGEALRDLLTDSGATILQATPLTWRMLLDAGWTGGLRVALCGGETLAPSLAAKLIARCESAWNIYGPTETTVWSTAHRLTPADRHTVPVGRPLPDTTVHVLDGQMGVVAVGERGEVWVGGGGVTRGYHGRPELTDECFVADPFGPAGGRLYRTGDLGRMRADGALELLGRADHQVKIRGHRVELGEIENWLQEHPSVAGAVVVPRLDGTEVRLTGYVRPDPDHPFEESQLRAHAAVRLPRHMVPGVFVRVDVWPRTPSGKIDRRALPEPGAALSGEVDGTSEAVCWDDATMGALAEVWQNVLGVPLSGPEANFFALGGHSLQAMQVVKGIRARLGVRVSAARMMQSPTLAEQAALVRAAVSAEAAPTANQ